MTKYEIYGKGGSRGEISTNLERAKKTKRISGVGQMWLLGTTDSKDEATNIAKKFKAGYSPGEKSYYGVYTRIIKLEKEGWKEDIWGVNK